MKISFDTTVYVAEALLGEGAERAIQATLHAAWRVYVSEYGIEEVMRVVSEKFNFPRRLAVLTAKRIRRRATVVDPGASKHQVPSDPKDSPILQAALAAGVDLLVTNDQHLLDMHPYEGLAIISLYAYCERLAVEGLLDPLA